MSKVLNVEKLEMKFQNLSRSRESIQGLSSWIMHHKEVYQEIVNQWLIGISKNYNTLSMFYVANEIIQGCGKKKCTEFREAFSKVLEEATSYENVKEFKDKIFRLLTLWKERNIYDEEFYQRITDNLNSASNEESSEGEEEEAEELSEEEIIKQFDKQNLINELGSMKSLESEINEKEDILNYADVPQLPDLDNIIVRKDCLDMLRKCDVYLKFASDYSKLVRKEISQRKKLMKELKNNCIFYNAQQKDVKEVSNAFRVYGKRVKIMETRLAEKISMFPLPSNSPAFSEDLSESTSTGVSYDTDDASKSTFSPINELSRSSFSSTNSLKQRLSFSDKPSPKEVSELFGSVARSSQSVWMNPYKSIDESACPEFSKSHFDKLTELIQETKSNDQSLDEEKETFSKEEEIYPIDKENTDIFHDKTNIRRELITSTSLNETDFTEKIKSIKDMEANEILDKEKITSERLINEPLDIEVISSTPLGHIKSIDKSTPIFPVLQTSTTEQYEKSENNPLQPPLEDNEGVDFLLEESLDKKSKTKLNYKRKIELLLKSKEKKLCRDQDTQEVSQKISMKDDSPLLNLIEEAPKHEGRKDHTDKISAHSKEMNIRDVENSRSVIKNDKDFKAVNSEGLQIHHQINAITKIDSDKNIDTTSSFMKPASGNLMRYDESLSVNTVTDSGLCSKVQAQLVQETLPLNPSDTFTGTLLSSFLTSMTADKVCSDGPKEEERESFFFNPSCTFTGTDLSTLTSSILTGIRSDDPKQAEKETLSFNPSSTFTGTDFSTLTSSILTGIRSDDPKQAERETLSFNPSSTFTGTALSRMSTDGNPKKTEKETVPLNKSSSFTGMALSSLMSGVSTDFLKNILQKNHQNALTKIENDFDEKALKIRLEDKSNPSEEIAVPNIPNKFKADNTTDKESLRNCASSDSVDILQGNSSNLCKTSDLGGTLDNIETENKALPSDNSTKMSLSPSDTASVSLHSDTPNSPLIAKEVEGTLSSNQQAIPSESILSKNNQLLDKNSNLLESLQSVLQCLSDNMFPRCDKTFRPHEYKDLEPPLPLKSVLKIYKYLHGDKTKFENDTFNCFQINSSTSDLHTVNVENASNVNNYEVMDMDCDSEEES